MMLDASEKLSTWRSMLAQRATDESTQNRAEQDDSFLAEFRALLSQDLNTPGMLAFLDEEIHRGLVNPPLLRQAADSLLGLRL